MEISLIRNLRYKIKFEVRFEVCLKAVLLVV